MDVSWPIATSWAAAACFALVIVGWFLVRRANRIDALRAEHLRKLDDLANAEEAWRAAVRSGTAADVVRAKREVVRLRDEIARLKAAISALLVLAAAGCATPKGADRVVVVTDHARIVEPGFIVPDYPAGEERWWLCTPTGLELMVPAFRREEW